MVSSSTIFIEYVMNNGHSGHSVDDHGKWRVYCIQKSGEAQEFLLAITSLVLKQRRSLPFNMTHSITVHTNIYCILINLYLWGITNMLSYTHLQNYYIVIIWNIEYYKRKTLFRNVLYKNNDVQ